MPRRYKLSQNCYPQLLPLILLLTLLPGCNDSNGLSPETYEQAWSLWQSQELKHYQFDYGHLCYCAPRLLQATVKVKGDTVYAFENPRGDGELLSEQELDSRGINLRSFQSIEELFEIIRLAEEDGTLTYVVYHPEIGYPETTSIDWGEVDAYYASEVTSLE
ncbi:MAG: DUF6174 domain-containing protein [Candidatus Neomarinimicrobiota bacterium]